MAIEYPVLIGHIKQSQQNTAAGLKAGAVYIDREGVKHILSRHATELKCKSGNDVVRKLKSVFRNTDRIAKAKQNRFAVICYKERSPYVIIELTKMGDLYMVKTFYTVKPGKAKKGETVWEK